MATLVELLNARIGKGGKSKASVADHLGVSERTIENYMNGTRQPKPNALSKLAKFLEFDLNEMTEGNSEQTVPRETPQRVQNGYSVSVQDKYIMLLEQSLKEKGDQLIELKTRLNELEGKQRDFLAKVEDSIERYEHLVLAQLQSKEPQQTQGNSPTVLQRVYTKADTGKKKHT